MTTQSNGAGFGAWIRRAIDAIDVTFCKMTRIQFDAPWNEGKSRRC